ncbi:hypothetical protein ACO0R3_001510 [Hanseniaspora guilliermondii]
MGLFDIDEEFNNVSQATKDFSEKAHSTNVNLTENVSENKTVKYLNKKGKIKELKKRSIYQEKTLYESTLLSNENFEDNKFTKHYFNKSIYNESNESKGKYGLNIKSLLEEVEKERCLASSFEQTDDFQDQTEIKDMDLWVEKYKPKNVMEIIGHEEQKLQILKWFRSWSLSTNNIPNKCSEENINDPYRRPEKKMILIEGKIGIGKNTLADTLSKVCGYDLIEVDNSDNTKQQLKEKISNILFSKNTVMGKNIVNCLLVDDSSNDSADLFSILLEFLRKDERETNNCINHSLNSGMTKNEQKLFSKSKQTLLRKPIICLTENINSKRLSHVKPFCEVIRLKQPALRKIVDFLQDIITEELHIKPSKNQKEILSRLVESCNGDLRNSLNNLQFDILESELINNIEVENIITTEAQTGIHGKDKSKSWYSLLVELFEPHNAQKDLSSVISNFTKLLDPFQNSFLSMINLSFDNYPVLIPNLETSSVSKYSKIFDILSESLFFWDVLNSFDATTGRLPQYGVVPLLNFAVYNYKIHEGSSMSYKSLNQNILKYNVWNTKSVSVQQNINEVVDMFRNTHNFVYDDNQKYFSYNDFNQNSQQLVQEYLPSLASLLSIDIMGSLKSIEKREEILLDIYHLFKAKGLRLVRSKSKSDKRSNTDDIYLSTDITEMNNFSNFEIISCNHKNIKQGDKIYSIPSKNNQLTALKNDEAFVNLVGNTIIKNQSVTTFKNLKFLLKKFEDFTHQTTKVSSLKRKTEDTPLPSNKKVKYVYANRPTDILTFAKRNKSNEIESSQITSNNAEGRVWIKYKEGFSNAVKKQLTWDSFF